MSAIVFHFIWLTLLTINTGATRDQTSFIERADATSLTIAVKVGARITASGIARISWSRAVVQKSLPRT